MLKITTGAEDEIKMDFLESKDEKAQESKPVQNEQDSDANMPNIDHDSGASTQQDIMLDLNKPLDVDQF